MNEKEGEDEPRIDRNVMSIINNMECPDPKIILELISIRAAGGDTTCLMIKSYLLGVHDGQINH